MKIMRVMTGGGIPQGLAALFIDDSGFVGTATGHPYLGPPALFPEAQARALCYAWNAFDLESLPNPDAIEDDVQEWLR